MSDRILIVDDDDNIQIFSETANSRRHRKRRCRVEWTRGNRIPRVDEAIACPLDVNMPGLDGWLVCEIINNVKRWKSIPVVFQTALQGSENIKRAVELVPTPTSRSHIRETAYDKSSMPCSIETE